MEDVSIDGWAKHRTLTKETAAHVMFIIVTLV